MAGSFRADAVAQRMRSITMKAFGPASRVGGVPCLCATPFAAGQAPAVRRQLLAIDGDSCIAFTGVSLTRTASPPARRCTARVVRQ